MHLNTFQTLWMIPEYGSSSVESSALWFSLQRVLNLVLNLNTVYHTHGSKSIIGCMNSNNHILISFNFIEYKKYFQWHIKMDQVIGII